MGAGPGQGSHQGHPCGQAPCEPLQSPVGLSDFVEWHVKAGNVSKNAPEDKNRQKDAACVLWSNKGTSGSSFALLRVGWLGVPSTSGTAGPSKPKHTVTSSGKLPQSPGKAVSDKPFHSSQTASPARFALLHALEVPLYTSTCIYV